MAEPRIILTTTYPVHVINAADRLRPIEDAGVEAIMASAREIGIKDAIDVREMPAKRGKPQPPKLIAGAHRLEAARRLEIELPVKVWHCTADQALLMEIDDNIAGAGMTALDTAVFLARRKAVYERLHPETAMGVFKGNQHTGNLVADIMSFTRSTAQQFGLTDRHVRRLIKAGSDLTDADINRLRRAEKPVTLKDLIILAKIGDPEERSAVCILIGEGVVKSVADARKMHAGQPVPVKDPVEDRLKALFSAWERAPKVARQRFVRDRFDDLEAAGLVAFEIGERNA